MSLREEYVNQVKWRSWDNYLEKLPIQKDDTILDMGCSIGIVSEKLSLMAARIIGIDKNPDLLAEARKNHSRENIKYIQHDLKNVRRLNLPRVDGIWSSFVVSYFPEFKPVLHQWLQLLKSGGWIALVEMSGLFEHRPLSGQSIDIFKNYYIKGREENVYDFEMGIRLKKILIGCGLSVFHEENMYDPELTFNGPADQAILKAWSDRFDRMGQFRQHLGIDQYDRLKSEFLKCITDDIHTSETLVKFIIAKK